MACELMIIGILGCGAIANTIVDYFIENPHDIEVKYLFDTDKENAMTLAKKVQGIALDDVEHIGDDVELLLECASPIAVKRYLPTLLKKTNVAVLSVGALMDKDFKKTVETIAKEHKTKIYIPSGAIIGIDGLNAANTHEINSISLVTRKNPKSLDVDFEEETVLFEGKSSEAVIKFPFNVNVSATTSLVANRDIDIKLISDPNTKANTHELTVEGSFGKFTTKCENVSLKNNPKTSTLAAYSAIKLLIKLNEVIVIGT